MSAKPGDHPLYSEMIKEAVVNVKDRTGCSRQAIEKCIKGNFDVGEGYKSRIKNALKRMSAKGELLHAKGTGASGRFKLTKVEKKHTAKKPAAQKKAKTPKKAGDKAKKTNKAAAKPKPAGKKAAKK